jgi:hypothetical protein
MSDSATPIGTQKAAPPSKVRHILTGPGPHSAEEIRAAAHEFCTYHAPTGDKPARFAAVSRAVEDAIVVLVETVPPSGDRTAAIRMLADARMVANRAISLDGAF